MTKPTAHSENQTLSASNISVLEENMALRKENIALRVEIKNLAERIQWFEKQIFGSKSEKRIIDNPHQLSLLTEPTTTEPLPEDKQTITYERGTAKRNVVTIV